MSVTVKDNNIDVALRKFRNEVNPILSTVRDKQRYKKPGVRRREEKKQNIINSRRNSKHKHSRSSRLNSKKYS